MNVSKAIALLLCWLLAGCAGWSTWEDERRGAGAPPAAPVGPGLHRVASGDTVYSIAFRNSLDYRQLARWNGIGSDYLIHPGQVLRLTPPPADTRPPQVTGEIESVGMDDVDIGRPRPIGPTSPPPPPMPAPTDPPDPTAVVGSYAWKWPTAGTVVRGYNQDGNRGIDFTGREGQPVFAAAPGRVVYSGNALKGYGELIIIKHDDVYLSAYGYNRSRKVKEGDTVTAGQVIGEMGRGPENKPLLHFEIRRRGKPINPGEKLPGNLAATKP